MLGLLLLIIAGLLWADAQSALNATNRAALAPLHIVGGALLAIITTVVLAQSSTYPDVPLLYVLLFWQFSIFFVSGGVLALKGTDQRGLGWFLQFFAITSFAAVWAPQTTIPQLQAFWLTWSVICYVLSILHTRQDPDRRIQVLVAYLLILAVVVSMWVPGYQLITSLV